MTAAAVSTKPTIVNIILAVTAITLFGQGNLICNSHPVTGFANDTFVGVFQGEICFFVVVELPGFPIIAEVTLLAAGTQAAAMRVVSGVTGVTAMFGFLEVAGFVAFLAGQSRMGAQ